MLALELVVIVTMLVAITLSLRQMFLTLRVGLVNPKPSRALAVFSSDAAACQNSDPRGEDGSLWPSVSILIPAHNEERVIEGCLKAMTAFDYPAEKLQIIVINDRSNDQTGEIINRFAASDARVFPLHRAAEAKPGKSSAVAQAMALVRSEVVVMFDADYLPSPGLLKELVLPFRDQKVGATMGRVVPYNSDANVLTRLLDLERRAGYAVDQHARALCQLVPQFGGTVGGIRVSALDSVGGWREGHLTEDTDLTFRLILSGWDVRYLNHATCYEEVPEDWRSRFKQVRRWAYGHNDCMFSYFLPVLASKSLKIGQKLDATMILLFYFFPVLAAISMFAAIPLLAYSAEDALVCYACKYIGPFLAVAVLAPFMQTAVAASQDQQTHVLKAMPLLFVSSAVSMLAASAGFVALVKNRSIGRNMAWDKTARFRTR